MRSLSSNDQPARRSRAGRAGSAPRVNVATARRRSGSPMPPDPTSWP